MPTAIEQTLQALQIIVQSAPVGTNLVVIHLMWSHLLAPIMVEMFLHCDLLLPIPKLLAGNDLLQLLCQILFFFEPTKVSNSSSSPT